jgi:GNAT superfamily N-acetyltransferase
MRWWWTGRGCLEVGVLWLDAPLRRLGYGSRLLRRAEADARAAGCARVELHTFSFQARPFYEKQGYRVFGQLDDYPPGASAYWMVKELD